MEGNDREERWEKMNIRGGRGGGKKTREVNADFTHER